MDALVETEVPNLPRSGLVAARVLAFRAGRNALSGLLLALSAAGAGALRDVDAVVWHQFPRGPDTDRSLVSGDSLAGLPDSSISHASRSGIDRMPDADRRLRNFADIFESL